MYAGKKLQTMIPTILPLLTRKCQLKSGWAVSGWMGEEGARTVVRCNVRGARICVLRRSVSLPDSCLRLSRMIW
jgi:hypothetical protein